MKIQRGTDGRVKVNGAYAVKVNGRVYLSYSDAERLNGLASASISNQVTTRTGRGLGKAFLAFTVSGLTVTHPTEWEVLDFVTTPSYRRGA